LYTGTPVEDVARAPCRSGVIRLPGHQNLNLVAFLNDGSRGRNGGLEGSILRWIFADRLTVVLDVPSGAGAGHLVAGYSHDASPT
jgi:hypothetical protein